jgi:hypothetical protein
MSCAQVYHFVLEYQAASYGIYGLASGLFGWDG